MTHYTRRSSSWFVTAGFRRVPRITVAFWLIKGFSTALGESTSDYLVHAMIPQLAVVLGFVAFAAALVVQFRMERYVTWAYWTTVVMVGVFGTMAADVLHVAMGVPYTASTLLYAAALAAVFVGWAKIEPTLSIHSIDTPRREAFYWAAVTATFAMGTALGDFSAYTLHLGYFASASLFAVLIAIPATGFRWLGWSPVLSFWCAYVMTRPLGASVADGLAKPRVLGGLAWGDGTVALLFAGLIIALVGILSVTHADVQKTRGPLGNAPARLRDPPGRRGPFPSAGSPWP